MNSQDILSLQEAYLEVYNELDEELTGERKERAREIAAQKTRTNAAGDKTRRQARWLSGRDEFSSIGSKGHPSQKFGSAVDPKKTKAPKQTIANNKRGPGVKKLNQFRNVMSDPSRPDNVPGHGMPQVDNLPRGKGSKSARRVAALKDQKEQTDLYDIILLHLLDEGYADTQEAAESIMVNMSEEWRESIVESHTVTREERKKINQMRELERLKKIANDPHSDLAPRRPKVPVAV